MPLLVMVTFTASPSSELAMGLDRATVIWLALSTVTEAVDSVVEAATSTTVVGLTK